jgi:outer membrane protein
MSLDRETIRFGIVTFALGVVVVVGIGAVPTATVQTTSRMAYVSSDVVLRQTPGYAHAESTLQAEVASYGQEIQNLQKQLDSATNQFNQQAIVLSATARQEKQQELQRLSDQYIQRRNDLQDRAQQRQRELVSPLEDRIQRVIDGLRAERNLLVIFDVSAPGNNIVSADPSLDLTQTVVTRLNASGGQ